METPAPVSESSAQGPPAEALRRMMLSPILPKIDASLWKGVARDIKPLCVAGNTPIDLPYRVRAPRPGVLRRLALPASRGFYRSDFRNRGRKSLCSPPVPPRLPALPSHPSL